jgi:regulatory protein
MPETNDPQDDTPYRDAEQWLRARGVEREPIRVRPAGRSGRSEQPGSTSRGGTAAAPPGALPRERPPEPQPVAEPTEATQARGEGEAPPATGRLGEEVARAVSYARRATAKTPLSEARLRRRMEERDITAPAVEQALRRCREAGIVDDRAFALALVDEGRRKGYAPARIERDLRRREIDTEVIDEALATIGDRDLEAAAYDVARRRATQLKDEDTEAVFRRLVGYLGRRGYPDALARKVARQAVFNDREVQRTTER